MDSTDEKKEEKPGLPQITDRFIHKLDALRESMDVMMLLADAAFRVAHEESLKTLDAYGQLVEENEKTKTYEIPLEHYRKINRKRRRYANAKTGRDLLPRTFLVAFVSEFDAFLGDFLRVLLELRPEILNGSERQLSYKDLVGFKTLDEARENVVSREIETFMRDSYFGQFKWLENKFGVKLREGLDRWATLIELTERRHLFVHSDGRVSTQYLAVCREHGVDVRGVELGSELSATREYLISAYKCLYEIGVKLCQVFWRKLCPDQLQEADGHFGFTTFELIVDERFDIATRLLEFHVSLPRHGSDMSRRIAIINLAQIHKWQKRPEECAKILNAQDWSSCNDAFGICRAVLEDRFEDARALMIKIGTSGVVTELDYREWPVFREFRESEHFREAFRAVFGKEPVGQESIDVADSAPAATEGAEPEPSKTNSSLAGDQSTKH